MLLKIYLLSGLILHKVVWEVLKRKVDSAASKQKTQSMKVRFIKAVKIAILLGIMVQTLLPDILPISSEPFVLRLVGVSVFTFGLIAAIASRAQLGQNWADIETGQVLRNQEVVAQGIYAYVRHPIYVGDLLLLLGLELALNSWLVLGVLLLAPIVMFQAVKEERMLVQSLPGYNAYCERTKRFIPFVI